ncbi:MAG TPA: hypothetical protein PKD64_17525 [Pirellulaceae bacterium]|nr:hypothetical protein [Pirellulaceae bacterium]HMO93989.1 hypothetical protein [Pirellulaceae bacterium]HMP70855.1 hypothetical protein [Pirellulaceae bacterium]
MALYSKIEAARPKAQEQKSNLDKTRNNMANWVQEKPTEIETVVRGWKSNTVRKNLNSRAVCFEAYTKGAFFITMTVVDCAIFEANNG